ncbi:MAG: sulfite exporter TauE/SafE family protein [Thermoplasmata archaeon]|nr:sulfite exporter TauE/SafE family protein [Thermoplasmata archaeon]
MVVEIITMIVIGIFAGIVTGLTGASGVMVVVPLLNMLLNFSVHNSIGTSLMVDVIASIATAYTYYRHGNVDLKSGIWIAIGSITGAQFGVFFAVETPEAGLGGAFGIFLIVMGSIIWKRGINRERLAKKINKVLKFKNEKERILTALVLGFIIGIITGIFGAGGGLMILFVLIFVLNFPLHLAIGTSVIIMAITASSGMVGYALHGNLKPLAGLILGISAALSATGSAKFANRIDEKILSKAVGLVFISLGIIMTVVNY